MSTNPLFYPQTSHPGSRQHSHDQLFADSRERVEVVVAGASAMDVASAEAFIERVVAEHGIKPIAIGDPQYDRVIESAEVQGGGSRGAAQRKVWSTSIVIPYTSGHTLLIYRPSAHPSLDSVRGGIVDDARWSGNAKAHIRITRTFEPGTPTPDEVKAWRDNTVQALREIVEAVNERVAAHNASLPDVARAALKARSAELDSLEALNRDLDE